MSKNFVGSGASLFLGVPSEGQHILTGRSPITVKARTTQLETDPGTDLGSGLQGLLLRVKAETSCPSSDGPGNEGILQGMTRVVDVDLSGFLRQRQAPSLIGASGTSGARCRSDALVETDPEGQREKGGGSFRPAASTRRYYPLMSCFGCPGGRSDPPTSRSFSFYLIPAWTGQHR
jgi:hypothetical protein